MSALEESRCKLADKLDFVQKKAYTKWVNSHLEKADIEIEDLFQDLRDGSILLLLLELFTGTKLKRERGKMKVHHIQNVQMAKSFLTDKKNIKIVGIPAEEIVAGNKKLTLGLVWTLILNFQLSGSLPDGDAHLNSPKQVSAKVIKQELLHWSQTATEDYEIKTTNFHNSWKDGMAFCAIINRHRPDLLDIDECDPNKPLDNLEKAFTIAETELNVIRFLDPEDIYVEKPSEEAILMYVSALKQAFPVMPPPHRKKGPSISPEEYSSCYGSLQEWINNRIELTANESLPCTVNDVRQVLEDFQKLRNTEDSSKEKEKEKVKTMAAEIMVFELKNKKDFGVPNIKELEQSWSECMAKSNEYETRLKEELTRLEGLDALSQKLQTQCNSVSLTLVAMDEQIQQFESVGGVSSENEELTELQGNLKSIKDTIEGLENSIQILKEGNHSKWSHFDEIVSGLWNNLSSLRGRLDDCVTSVSDVRVLLAEADSKLRECEMWLLEHGKFCDNQLIVEQKDSCETFNKTTLTETRNIMNKVNSSSIAAGCVDEIRDLNKRWDQIQEQLQNRITNLSTITATVNEFDVVKLPLQEWCVQQHNQTLPLLETDPQELLKQKEEFQQILSKVLSYEQAVESLDNLSVDFLKHKEPIQTFADKYARRLKRVSRNFAAAIIKDPSQNDDDDDSTHVSLFEQSEMLRSEWERNKAHIQQRLDQADELLERLKDFERLHSILLQLIEEGNTLLDNEHPVGTTAQRIEEQTATCQAFRLRLTDAQTNVDSMLALGRSIISEYYTNPDKDTLSQTLTDFISNWSNLLLSWQNWFDELHATGEQSRDLSDQFIQLKQSYKIVEPKHKEIFPATVTMETLDSDLKNLQDDFNKELLEPIKSLKKTYSSLLNNAHLLSEKEEVERILAVFVVLLERIETQGSELDDVIDNVNCWWTECSTIQSKVEEMRYMLVEDLPLAGSTPCIKKQDEYIQNLLLETEEMNPKVLRAIKHLSLLAEHETLLVCKPILIYRDELQHHWKALYEQVETRRDVIEVGRVRLNVYVENREPFSKWLREAKSRLNEWCSIVNVDKSRLMELNDSLRAFKMDVEMHNHEMECCELMANKFTETAKKHQSNLSVYRQKLLPNLSTSQLQPEHFFDWETDTIGITIEGDGMPSVDSDIYCNGLKLVGSDINSLKKRFNKLKGRVTRRTARFVEARDKRLNFQESLEMFLPKLEETELLLHKLLDAEANGNRSKDLKEQLELMEALENEFSSLRSLMDPLNMSAAAWTVREPLDSESEDNGDTADQYTTEYELVQERYSKVEQAMKNLRETLESSLAEAQAFQSSYSSFASWLRDTERKIQKDDPLKLETTDLKSGLAYLKAVKSDISGHTQSYHDLCKKFESAIEFAKKEEKDDLKEKLDNLESRWNSIQVIQEDIEATKATLLLLESFNVAYQNITQTIDDLIGKFRVFSPSAITGSDVDKKKTEFENLLTQFNSCQSELDSLLTKYEDLFNTPFDQTKFLRLIDTVQNQIKECKKLKDDKSRAMKHIVTRIKTLERNWVEFVSWLSISEDKMEGLDQSLVGGSRVNLSDQLKQLQVLQEDISEHESMVDSIESLVASLTSYLEHHHMEKLQTRFNNLFGRYRCLYFSSEAFPVQVWIHNRKLDIIQMDSCAVMVRLLQSQIQEMSRYKTQLESYERHFTELKQVLKTLPEHSSDPEAKMADIESQYTKLGKVASQREKVLTSALPRLKLYENSLDNWDTILNRWEESAIHLAPPTTAVMIIQSTVENIKALQIQISNQEPEFHALVREARQMYAGSEDDRLLAEKLKTIGVSCSSIDQPENKPGQLKLQERLGDYQKRLDGLKKNTQSLLLTLKSLNEKSTCFNQLLAQLLPWLQDHQSIAARELQITDPSYQVLQNQLTKCQSVQNNLKLKKLEKAELMDVYNDIITCLPSESKDIIVLKAKTDEVLTCWSNLSDQISLTQSKLEPSTKLAKSFENSEEKLTAFIKQALNELTGLGPIPSEPEAVQELKIRIDDLKSEYNSLIPLFRKCTEDGNKLHEYCTQCVHLKETIEELETKWNSVGTMLTDIHQKLTEALVQTQEFQQVAESLDRWVNATQSSLKRLEPVAVRVRLIRPQMEGLKPVIEDINVNSNTLEQVKIIGEQLLAEATTEERLKIGKKLHSLEMRFYGLDKTTRTRTKELQDALLMATEFEGSCSELSDWFNSLESQLSSFSTTPIRSQPLMTLMESSKEFSDEVKSHEHLVTSLSNSETVLFETDMTTIKKYELRENFIEYLSSPQHSRGPSPMYHKRSDAPVVSDSTLTQDSVICVSSVHPEFLDRPGCLEALEIGAKLRNRYKKLKHGCNRREDEITMLLKNVTHYERQCVLFSDWLQEIEGKLQNQKPLVISCDKLRNELQIANSLQNEMTTKEETLESINSTGTSLVEGCQDDLSRDSVRESLSDLNDKWGTASKGLDDRIDTTKKGLALTNSYETMEKEYCSWLNDTEAKLDRPVSITGSTSEMQQIIRKLDIIQGDIDNHKSHLESLTATGESLESFAAKNNISDMSPPLCYRECKSRYEGLVHKLNTKKKGSVDDVNKASLLKGQLVTILEKLKPLKSQLDNHEPPHLSLELVSEQLHNIESIGNEYGQLDNDINQLSEIIDCFHLEDGSELYNLYSSVTSLCKDVKASQQQWLSKLQKARDSALQFDKDYDHFSKWIGTMQQQLNIDEGIRATVDGVERQIRTVQDINEDISSHSSALQKLMDLGRNMMMGSSSENCILIGDKLAHIQSGYESLQRHAFGKVQSLKDSFVKVKEFNDEHDMLLEKLQDKERDILIIPPVGTDVETVRAQLEEFKDFELEITEMKVKVTSCQSKGKQIKDICYHDDKSKVEEKLEELNTEWNKLQALSIARQQDLENALLRLGQFREAFLELIGWIRDCSQKLSQRKEPGVGVEDLEQQLQDLKVLQSEIVTRDPSVTSLNDASKKLIDTSQDEASSKEIQADMTQLNHEWQQLKSLAANQQLVLSTAHERARVFVSDLRDIMKRFNTAEENTSNEWLPHVLPDACQQDIDQHQELAGVIQGLKDPMVSIKSEADGLKGQASDKEFETLLRLMGDMEDRWERLVITIDDKQSQLESAKESAVNFDNELVAITNKLDSLEAEVNRSSSIHSEAEEVKKQLHEHKELLLLLEKCESDIVNAEAVGGALIKDCVPSDRKTVKKQLAKLRSQYDQLQSLALTRLSNLEEALLTVGKFEEAYQELQTWLVQAWDKLQILERIPSQSEPAVALYAKHKVFMKELAAKSSSHTSVIKAGKELLKTKNGEDRNTLKSKMADLDHEWEGVSQMSSDYQQKLETAIKKLRQFESQVQPIKNWMMNILSRLDDSQPVDGDITTVQELAHTHEIFQNELGAHQHNIDGIINLGEDIMSNVVDNESPLKENLDQIRGLWKDTCNLSVTRQERLLKAQKTALQFQQSVMTLWSWMEQKEAEIDLMNPPSEDEHELQQQIQQHTMFEETVQGHQHVHDAITTNGHNLYRVSHPKAEPVLSGQLQQLQQKWKQLKGKIHSRSEALESSLLEIHGLQDSIDELSIWVGSAEEDLANAEGLPIGDEMDSVETQLSYHEAFQEEMAKHQPKMEALNKANKRRKSRASLVPGSVSSPEITKKISNLDRRWKKLWMRSNERHRQLLEAQTRLKDIALARSFNFDAWCKKFVSWVDQQKLRVSDLFRRFDSNHDGMLSREEFMKGLKASGLAMNQIEMEKIADSFDRNRSGLIDLAEIIAVLKGQKVHRQFKTKTSATAKPASETEKIDLEIQQQLSKCCCEHKYQAIPVKAGQYKFGDSQKLRMVRILRSTVMVRVGGGWEPLDTFLAKNDPCRSSGRLNADVLPNIGVGKVTFKSKVQTVLATKGEETKKMAERDPTVKRVTKTLHDGRQETVLVSKRTSVPAMKTTGRDSPAGGIRRTYTGTNISNKPTTPTRKTGSLNRFTSPPGEGHLSTIRPRTPSTPADSLPPRAKTPSRNGVTNLTTPTTPSDRLRPPSRGSGTRISPSSKIPTPVSKIPTPGSRARPPSRQK